VTATYSAPSPNYTLATPGSKTLTITQEDARVSYGGDRLIGTGGDSTATIQLTADVRDIANTSEANGDNAEGDIRLAKVTFINRLTGAVIASNVPVVIDPADANNGLATFNWNVNIGSNSLQAFTVGFVVTGYYNRNSTSDNTTIYVGRF
jgi:hypothetical protein